MVPASNTCRSLTLWQIHSCVDLGGANYLVTPKTCLKHFDDIQNSHSEMVGNHLQVSTPLLTILKMTLFRFGILAIFRAVSGSIRSQETPWRPQTFPWPLEMFFRSFGCVLPLLDSIWPRKTSKIDQNPSNSLIWPTMGMEPEFRQFRKKWNWRKFLLPSERFVWSLYFIS